MRAAEWSSRRVKAVRAALGETQKEFAARFRLHPETVRTWEQGRRYPVGPATVLLELLEDSAGKRD